jgi:hypothetical protein
VLFGSNKDSCDGDTCRRSDGQLPKTVGNFDCIIVRLLPCHLVHRKITSEAPQVYIQIRNNVDLITDVGEPKIWLNRGPNRNSSVRITNIH